METVETVGSTEAIASEIRYEKTCERASRKEILGGFIGVVVVAFALFAAMTFLQPLLMGNNYIYSFNDLMAGCQEGGLLWYVAWFFADLTEGSFLASMPASIALVAVGFVAAALERKGSVYAGTGVDGSGKIFTAMFFATVASLILGQILFNSFFATGWIPTFATVLTVQAFIIFYGVSWKKLVTVILVGTVLTFPACYLLLQYVVSPLGLPLFIAVSAGVAIVVPVCSAIYRLMPWMERNPGNAPAEPPTGKRFSGRQNSFFVHRVFGDIGNLVIWGSSYATIGMYIGAIISWVLNPESVAYGSGVFPTLMFAQIITAACAIFVWWPKWKEGGWAFTFAGVVFVSAILCTYPAAWQIIIPTIVIGVLVFAPYVEFILKLFRYKEGFHAIALIQVSIFTVCVAWSFIVMHGIMPLI